MKFPSLAMGAFLALVVAACAGAPPPSPSTPVPLASQPAAMAPTGTPMMEASTATPGSDGNQTAAEPRPTITINPRLHATNPQNVKLASGDQPTLVEFFAFW